ncbi:MAG: hypothetical protein ACHQNT_13480 [Bacteroidia bacterium]
MKTISTPGPAANTIDLLQKRVANTIDLSLEKVAMHLKDSAAYPITSDKKTIERAILDLYYSIPEAKRKKFTDKLNERFQSTTAERQLKYGDLLNINLHNSEPVASQVKKLELPVTHRFSTVQQKEFEEHYSKHPVTGHKRVVRTVSDPKPQGLQPRTFSLFLDKIICKQPNDIRKDEIDIAGFVVDALQTSTDIKPFFAGKFKKGESANLGKKIFDFDLRAAGTFPQLFTAGFVIVEKDWFESNTADKLISALEIIAATSSVLLFVFGGLALITPPGVDAVFIILMFVSLGIELLSVALQVVIQLMKDDFFTPVIDSFIFDIPPVIPVGADFNRSLEPQFLRSKLIGDEQKVNGKYTLNIRWERTA